MLCARQWLVNQETPYIVRRLFRLCLLLALSACSQAPSPYVGATQCASCHGSEYKDWQGSDHWAAMAPASDATVLGDFNNAHFVYGKITSTFYRQGKEFWVRTDNAQGELQAFRISDTFGIHPLQQYMVDFPDGRKQVLNIAWDSRPAQQGGQRWFHLYPTDPSLSHAAADAQAIKAGDPLHWTGTYFNWNSRCASCHSTNLQKRYDANTDHYDTKWSEINVACESCHGPGAKHLAWAKSANKNTRSDMGLAVSLTNTAQWKYLGEQPPLSDIKRRVSAENAQQPQVCAQCHSRRQELSQWNPALPFADQHVLRLLEPGLYAADGQMQEEVYVYGSFLQSKMHQNGVVCSNCHNPHSLKLKFAGNATCTQCHRASVFDTTAHSHHKLGSDGALCVNCHMPTVTYMGVDARRDHSFRLPRPLLEAKIGSEEVCTNCHRDQTAAWAQKAIDGWALPAPRPSDAEHFANAFHAVDQGMARDSNALVKIANDMGVADIVRGSAALRLGNVPDPHTVQEIDKLLHDKSWLVRLGAVRAVENFPADLKWQLLQPHLDEPVAAIRYVLAQQLADISLQDLAAQDQARLQSLYAEYLKSLSFTDDSPESRAAKGLFELQRKQPAAAEQDFLAALKLAPKLEGALLNLADLYRVSGRDELGGPLLQRATVAAPGSALAHYALGLWQIRHQQFSAALKSIDAARQLLPRDPQFALAAALLLEQTPARRADAATLLQQWQAQYGENEQMQSVLGRLQSEAQ